MIQAFQRLSLNSNDYFTQISDLTNSQQLNLPSPIIKIDNLLLHNFKSYKQKVFVGPFLGFSCIVGCNGSGKSNVLDAFIFCFCGEKNRRSYFDVREIIRRTGGESYDNLAQEGRKCCVEVRFKLEGGEDLVLSRELDAQSNQQFYINYHPHSRKTYEAFLLRHNLNHISENYSIFQNEVDKLLLKTPEQLTNHFQNLSLSIYYKRETEDLSAQLKAIFQKIERRTHRLMRLKIDKKDCRNLKKVNNEGKKLEEEYEGVLGLIFLGKVLEGEREIKAMEKDVEKKYLEEEVKVREINEAKVKMQKQHRNKMELQKTQQELSHKITTHQSQLKQLTNTSAHYNLTQDLHQLSSQISSNKSYLESLQISYNNFQSQSKHLKESSLTEQYLELYTKWENENQLMNKQLIKKRQEYFMIEGLLQSKTAIKEQYEHKISMGEEMTRKGEEEARGMQREVKDLEHVIDKIKGELKKSQKDIKKGSDLIVKKQGQLDEVATKIMDLENLLTQNLHSQKDQNLQKKLKLIPSYVSFAHQKVKPTTHKYELVFNQMLSPILNYLICMDEQSSKQIAIKLKQENQLRNVLILENVKQKTQRLQRGELGKLAIFGIDVVDYDKDLSGFGQFLKDYLGGKVVCDNFQAGVRLRDKMLKGVKQIYTIDGHIMRSDGVISAFGDTDSIKKNYKHMNISKNTNVIYNEIEKLEKQKIALEEELKVLKNKYSHQDILAKNLQLTKLQNNHEELRQKIKNLRSTLQKPKKMIVPKEIMSQIKQLTAKRQKLQKNVQEIEQIIGKSKIFDEFLKKNKIQGLQMFRNINGVQDIEEQLKMKVKINRQIDEVQSQIKKVKQDIELKIKKIQKLQQKEKQLPKQEDKSKIEKQLQKDQKSLISVREQLTKIQTDLSKFQQIPPFKPEASLLKTKLSIAKQKFKKSLQEQSQKLSKPLQQPFNYSLLEDYLQIPLQRISNNKIQQLMENLQKQKKHLQEQLEKNNIYLLDSSSNGGQDEAKIGEQIQEENQMLQELVENKDKIIEKLDVVKSDRKKLFNTFLQILRPILKETYAILTETQDGRTGKVDIYCENEANPFSGGLYFTPTPPNKRFVYDLEQLSGGERSVASLSLQYAIAIATKSTFLILDECDAFLDIENGSKMKKLLENTINKNLLQLIVITHKPYIFEQSDSLVGVTRRKGLGCSNVYSLKMGKAEEEESSQHSSKNQSNNERIRFE